MNKEEIFGAFSLVHNPIALSEEEVKDVQKAIKVLQQENKQLKEQLGKLLGLNENELWLEYNKEVLNLQKENIEFEERIDKAIEYIKIQQKIFRDYDIVSENQLKNLLEILKGE